MTRPLGSPIVVTSISPLISAAPPFTVPAMLIVAMRLVVNAYRTLQLRGDDARRVQTQLPVRHTDATDDVGRPQWTAHGEVCLSHPARGDVGCKRAEETEVEPAGDDQIDPRLVRGNVRPP